MTVPPLLMLAEGRRPRARKARAPRPKELVLHMSTANLLRRFARPDWQWTHFPSGELRDGRTAGKLKQMGLKPGWPDFVLVSPSGKLHALELKRQGEDLTDDQEEFHTWCIRNGVPRAVADTLDQVVAVLSAWGVLRVKIGGAP